MTITCKDLYNSYLRKKEVTRRQQTERIQEHIKQILGNVSNENELGKTSCSVKIYLKTDNYTYDMINELTEKLRGIYVDSSIKLVEINLQEYLIEIDWNPDNKFIRD